MNSQPGDVEKVCLDFWLQAFCKEAIRENSANERRVKTVTKQTPFPPLPSGETVQYEVWSTMETSALFSLHYFPVFPWGWPEVSYNPQDQATEGARLAVSQLFIQPPAHILYPTSSCKVAESWRQQIFILTESFPSQKKITKGHWRTAANLLAAPGVLSSRIQSSTAIFHSLWTWHPAVVMISPSCC